jgi:hypothetical protein
VEEERLARLEKIAKQRYVKNMKIAIVNYIADYRAGLRASVGQIMVKHLMKTCMARVEYERKKQKYAKELMKAVLKIHHVVRIMMPARMPNKE